MHKTSKGGSYRLDRVFAGVGRIAMASGCATAAEYHKRNDMLSRLHEKARLDLLTALRDGALGLTELYVAYRDDKLDSLTGDQAKLNANLWKAVESWVPTSAKAPATRRRYETSFAALKRCSVLPEGATVASLESVDWRALEIAWKGSAADWNHLRRAVSHFLALYLGDVYHPVRRAVVKAMPKRPEVERVPDLPQELFWAIVNKAVEHVRPALITIAACGLRVGEYLALTRDHLMPHTCSVRVPGTKTASSADVVRVDERLWPWVLSATPAPVGYKWLRLYWKRALKAAGAPADLRLHDLRHCYGQWLANEGVPE